MYTEYTNRQPSYSIGRFFSVAIFLTVISQLPIFVEYGITNELSIGIWILFLVRVIIKNPFHFNNIQTPVRAYVIFYIFVFVAYFFNNKYLTSEITYAMLVSLFMLLVGNLSSGLLCQQDIEKAFNAYIYATFILALTVYYSFLRGADYSSTFYAYNEKNSTGLIVMTAVIFITYTKVLNENKNFLHRLLYLIADLLLLVCIIIMQSRAVLVSILFFLIALLFSKQVGVGTKVLIIVGIFVGYLYLHSNVELWNDILNKYIYAGRVAGDMNSLSSGRWIEWQRFGTHLEGNWLFGYGRARRESLILASILSFGVPMGCLVIWLGLYPVISGRKFEKLYKSPQCVVFFTIAVCYAVNMFFEQLAPFGPGAKCFILWLLLGIYKGNEMLLTNY